jgi:hypothetical protein
MKLDLQTVILEVINFSYLDIVLNKECHEIIASSLSSFHRIKRRNLWQKKKHSRKRNRSMWS